MARVIIIGGGASGLVTAILAAREGADVTILERTDRVGKKILATGNGRCNLTNVDCNIRNFHGINPKFAMAALTTFNPDMTLQFFEELGITHKVEAGGKVYPYSDQASSVLDVLRMELERLDIDIQVNTEVIQITKTKAGFKVVCKDNSTRQADKLVVATGGKASPKLGSNGSGLTLLESLGHSTVTPFPSLVQVLLDTSVAKRIKGVKVQGKVTICDDRNNKQEEAGEILFTEDGISGPPIFQISRMVGSEALQRRKCKAILDLFPEHTLDEILIMLQMKVAYQPEKKASDFLIGMINKKLIVEILKAAGINDINRKCVTLSTKELEVIANVMKKWEFIAIGTRSWDSAQVMAGGIDTSEVNPKTFESLQVEDLYIVGEVLDIDGDCGGFNLQWAWSSAYMAAMSLTNI